LGGTIVHHITRVLAAVDFSKPARGAFDYALALSKRHQAELVAVQAVPLNQAFSSHGRARLALTAKLQRKARQAGVEFSHRIQQGDPARVILLHARSLTPDVIVVGTHQRRGIDRFTAGSVAERVAAKATAPVLVIPWHRSADTMRPFTHVAVAVDFSAASDQAIERALALATGPDDRITLLHVVPGFSAGAPPHLYRYGIAEYQDQLIRDARQRLELAVPGPGRTLAVIDTRVLVGDTSEEISRVVGSIGADLLIAGVPKRGPVSRAVFGITAGRLLRVSRVPMLAVPAVAGPSARQVAAALQTAA
jgi:nucleotide-binding universal stress UspA family protein